MTQHFYGYWAASIRRAQRNKNESEQKGIRKNMRRKEGFLIVILFLGIMGSVQIDVVAATRSANPSPVLSPDGKHEAFVRQSEDKRDELWLRVIKNGAERLLVREITYPSKEGPEKKPLYRIVDEGIHFSPDGKVIYFISADFETSGGIHSVNVENGRERYVIDGSEMKVILSGEYKGDLIFRQHRYFLFGPSYDWIWLYTPEGKEVGPVAEDWSGVDRDRLDFEEKEGENR